jgi:hypothetical protein
VNSVPNKKDQAMKLKKLMEDKKFESGWYPPE